MKAYLKERLYVPLSFLEGNDSILEQFTYKIDDVACQRCSAKHENPDACLECPLYETREIRTYSRDKGYMTFCRGNLGKIYKIFRELEIVDQTTNKPFKYDLKFTSKLWDNQVVTTNNWLKYKYGIIESPPRSGKAQPLYSQIKIPNGWKTMGSIVVGDVISTPDGKTANVTHVFPQGMRPTYRMTLEDGRYTDCDENHLWKVYEKSEKSERILSLKEIMDLKSEVYIPCLTENPYCRIKDIVYLGMQETQCILIDHPDHLYITDDFIITHNTMCSCFIAGALKQKTLVLTHQQDLLDQFLTTFQNHTNLKELQEKYNTDKIVGITNCREDLTDYDVCLCTYQSFITDKGKEFLESIRNAFGLVIVDECHLVSASCFRNVTNSLNAKYRLGLSATPERKDNLECLAYDIIGPITSTGFSNEMHCKVIVMNTGVEVHPFRQWTTFIKRLSENDKRNQQICEMTKKDVDNGRYVLIVAERIKHIDELAKMLRADGLKIAIYDGRVPKFNRKKLLDDIRSGKYEAVIAMRKMIKLGIDIPILDTYYHIIPMAFDKNYYQEMSRVRTPYPKDLELKLGREKPTPLIRVFLDYGHAAVYACYNIIDKVHGQQGFEVRHTESVFVKKEKKKKASW